MLATNIIFFLLFTHLLRYHLSISIQCWATQKIYNKISTQTDANIHRKLYRIAANLPIYSCVENGKYHRRDASDFYFSVEFVNFAYFDVMEWSSGDWQFNFLLPRSSIFAYWASVVVWVCVCVGTRVHLVRSSSTLRTAVHCSRRFSSTFCVHRLIAAAVVAALIRRVQTVWQNPAALPAAIFCSIAVRSSPIRCERERIVKMSLSTF